MRPRSTAVPVVLDALADADCRSILGATGNGPLTVAELVTTCDLPRSTLYRKVETLADAGLLDERVRMREHGPHPSAYARRVAAIEVGFGDDGVRVRLVPDDTGTAAPRSAEHADPSAVGSPRAFLPIGTVAVPDAAHSGPFDGPPD